MFNPSESDYEKVIALTKQSKHYKAIFKNYRKVAGYLPFSEVAARIALAVASANQIDYHLWKKDLALEALITSGKVVEMMGSPVYWLDKYLMLSLLNTDIPRGIEIKKVFPWAIIMLPTNIIFTPDNRSVDWLLVHYIDAGYKFPDMKFGKYTIEPYAAEQNKLRWCMMVKNGPVYNSTVALLPDGSIQHGDYDLKGVEGSVFNDKIDLEKEFTYKVEKLVINILLYLQYFNPSLEEEKLPPVTKGIGFSSQSKQKSESYLNPIWIGKGYKQQREREPVTGTHASPRTHWRRGHYKRVPVGVGRAERKWAWIEPTLVNAD